MTHIHQLDPYKVQEITTLGKADDSQVAEGSCCYGGGGS